ncbi:homeobox-leucine zipper protein ANTHOCYANINLESS 2-like [Papaver somniferum]|nr:homeobox-leucine zipper protein ANTHOCYANINLESS 2-like [Papaver somniferum]
MDGYGRRDNLRENLDECESGSGSDDLDGANSDEQVTRKQSPKKRKYCRHAPEQVRELEAWFKECPHPSYEQRIELSNSLALEPSQVKFWFQNRRTQMKNQIERNETLMLRKENDQLRAENIEISEAIRNLICKNCRGKAMLGEVSLAEGNLRIENARLKEELNRVSAIAGKSFGGMNQDVNGINPNLLMGDNDHQFPEGGISGGMPSMPVLPHQQQLMSNVDRSDENLELAVLATQELVLMAQTNEPLWIPSGLDGGRETLNEDEYMRMFTPACVGPKPGVVTEATRETGVVIINTVEFLETLMDAKRYMDMFPSVIARCNIINVISRGAGGTRNGALQLMYAEFRVLSTLVPVREVNFLRYCKQHAEGVWSVVDISVDVDQETSDSSIYSSRRLPSGCVVQPMPNGYSKVTWVEHTEYREKTIHQLYEPLINSGLGFGAPKWIATLQRQCECNMPIRDRPDITQTGMKNMLKLAQRMTQSFSDGVRPSSMHPWNIYISTANVDANVRLMTRTSINDPGIPAGIVMNAATSVWLPISQEKLFDYLRNENLRSQWDVLSTGGSVLQVSHIKGQDPGNCISLLHAGAVNGNHGSTFIFQETCTDASGSLVVYAAVDLLPMNDLLMGGGDSDYIQLLPCGFSIVPDGDSCPSSLSNRACADRPNSSNSYGNYGSCGSTMRQLTSDDSLGRCGSLLTASFQILVSSSSTGEPTLECVESLCSLITNTLEKLKAAVQMLDVNY